MNATVSCRYDTLRGTIDTVDLLERMVRVQTGEAGLELTVPVECQIMMYEEHVRLRMLQPWDAVEVLFTWDSGQAVAQSIEVLSPVRRMRSLPNYQTQPKNEPVLSSNAGTESH